MSPVPRFFRRIEAVYACRSDNLPVDLRQKRRVTVTLLFLFQVCFFLFQGQSDFFRIGRQEFRFPVGEHEIVPYALRILPEGVAGHFKDVVSAQHSSSEV